MLTVEITADGGYDCSSLCEGQLFKGGADVWAWLNKLNLDSPVPIYVTVHEDNTRATLTTIIYNPKARRWEDYESSSYA